MRRAEIFLGAVVAVAIAGSANAALCGKRGKVVGKLQDKYSEQLTAGGLQASRTVISVIEVWSSPETGTFTVLETNAHGVSCIIGNGGNWHYQKYEEVPKGTEH